MSASASAAFVAARRTWLEHLVTLILNPTASSVFAGSALTSAEQAMLVVHIGMGHLYGIADADSVVEYSLSSEQVEGLTSRYWRDGRFPPHRARTLPFLWPSLYRLGRDTGGMREELLGSVFNSQLGRRIRRESSHDLEPKAVDTRATEYIEKMQLQPASNDREDLLPLDCKDSHLRLVKRLLAEGVPIAIDLVTLLEVHACIPMDDQARLEVEALEEAGNHHEIFRSMPGGWPGPNPSDVPDWVRDVVVGNGARMFYASTGHVPSWLLVAESNDELQAIHRWSYEPNFGFGVDGSGNPVLSIQLTFPRGTDTADAWWHYPLHDVRSIVRLRTLIAIGIVRLDVYKISAEARLEFVFAFGCPLPLPIREACLQFLEENSILPSEFRLFHPMTPDDELMTMTLVQRNMFDGLSRGMHAIRADSSSPLAHAYRKHLETLDLTTAAAFGGLSNDDLYQESRENLRIALAQAERPPRELIDLGVLGAERGYVQFRVKLDEPVQLVAYAAYIGEDGELRSAIVEFDGKLSTGWDIDGQAAALEVGFSELSALLADGVSKLVVCPAPAAYNLPYHEALLRLGFEEVSYTHRLATLERTTRSNAEEVAVLGFAGEGLRYIGAVETELEVISHLYDVTMTPEITGAVPRIVHLAGHGHAGNRSYETAMEIGAAGPPLSSARVLLDFDASNSELVFLSACSSGRGTYHPDQMAEAIPVDVAFIEAGARTLVSTSTPVNDYIACFFGTVFHSELLAGTSLWEAFIKAREAARSGELPNSAEAIERFWPNWDTDIRAALTRHPHDWESYRLSGRHWD